MTTTATMNEIVFDQRNKSYGAYELRKTYDKHVSAAIAVAIALFLLSISMPTIIKLIKGEQAVTKTLPKKKRYTELDQPPPVDKTIPPPPAIPVPPPVKTLKFVPPTITQEEVQPQEEMPTIEQIKVTPTGNEDMAGKDVVFDLPPNQEVIEDAPAEIVYVTVEQPPTFPGGLEELMNFLGKKTKYPPLALRMSVEGTVFVGFIVSKEGRIDDVTVVKGLSKECDDEAMRVVKSMPNWIAGKQNGRAVAVKFVLPIKFRIDQ